jgi:hypothetical protein
MNERECIQEAFESRIKLIFASLLQSYNDAQGDAAKEKKAEDAFRNGVAFSRRVRDRALTLLP